MRFLTTNQHFRFANVKIQHFSDTLGKIVPIGKKHNEKQ